jgi:uncharacterized protein YdhG (YjbR/CyaY superfamily)
MKKANSRNRRAGSKSKIAPKNVDEYLAGIPESSRGTFNKMRAAIRSAVPPQAAEIISYRIPAFKDKGVLVWFAAFSNHCSLFPTAAVIEAFKEGAGRAERKQETALTGVLSTRYNNQLNDTPLSS